ncbi:MAG: acyl-CoA dehydrogenase [Pseudomonadota bacterium]
MTFAAPVRDMRYALDHMAGFENLVDTGAYEDLSGDLLDAILGEAGKLATEVVAPLNWTSDQKGAELANGVVTTSPGFKEAYGQYVEGGWNGLSFPTEYGGQGLPFTLSAALVDVLNAACMSFAIGLTLTTGAVKAILAHGTDAQKQLYLPKMVSGAWTGTMNLTEPQAGSDLAAVRAKATPNGDGTYSISGSKIYITYGEHDFTDNIAHLVLARLPDAPEGTRGISMFLVPKFHVNPDGSLGKRNDVKCIGIEHKMGLHGSPTCTMAYGEAGECVGWLVGEENRGLNNMFTMMNSARLDVGLQGVGVAEGAFQKALAYAQERKQGRPIGQKSSDQVEIIAHPDVRRMLYTMKTMIEASRGICYSNAVAFDLAKTAQTDEERHRAKGVEELLTPISKAFSTDVANEVSSIGVQVHGGMGYVEETGAAQYMRDARIAAIYEGTNGIQAMDLVSRKLPMEGGAVVQDYLDEVKKTAKRLGAANNEDLKAVGARLESALGSLSASTHWLSEALPRSPNDALAGATPYLRQFGLVAGAQCLARGAIKAAMHLDQGEGDAAFYGSKIALARFYADNLLPQAAGLEAAVTAGADTVAPLPPEALAG